MLNSYLACFPNHSIAARPKSSSKHGSNWFQLRWSRRISTQKSWSFTCTSTSWSMSSIRTTNKDSGPTRLWRSSRQNSKSTWIMQALSCQRHLSFWRFTRFRTFLILWSTLLSSLCLQWSGSISLSKSWRALYMNEHLNWVCLTWARDSPLFSICSWSHTGNLLWGLKMRWATEWHRCRRLWLFFRRKSILLKRRSTSHK